MIEIVWFCLVAIMIAGYVVLDGFDLGAGIIHLLVARTNEERQLVLRTIGPVWDGNEVWLLAGGGTLYFAFPALYASAFSGFYLALMVVLWLLIIRGASIELRSQIKIGVWHTFFDGMFCFSSALLAIFFGAALANVIRGVPLGADGYFFLPLWTNWLPGADPGILDWYTVLGGVIAFVALAIHGALYLAVKTEGDLQKRARRLAQRSWVVLVALTVISLPASMFVRRDTLDNYRAFPLAFGVPALVLVALAGMIVFSRKEDDRKAFGSSCVYLAIMLVGAAVGLYPRLLPSSSDPAMDITIGKALSSPHTLQVGLIWWALGMLLALLYFVVVYRMFKGKVSASSEGYGH